ncbi:MAG: hypothetical protein QM756_39570 [Polyangiaceae bacterium]
MRFRLLSCSLVAGTTLLLTGYGCSPSDPDPEPMACTVMDPTECPTPAPTYTNDVAPIIAAHCTRCHTGIGKEPWPLGKYEDVVDWEQLIRADILDCSMPPPDSGEHVTNDERLTILTWIRCGTPE